MSFEIDPKTGKLIPMSDETWEKINSRSREEYGTEPTPKGIKGQGSSNIAEILRKLLEGSKVGKDGTLILQKPKSTTTSDTSPIESPDGKPVTKKAPIKLRDYTDEELTKRFQPTYSSESSKPKEEGSYGYKYGPDNTLVPLTEDERNRIKLYQTMSGTEDIFTRLLKNSTGGSFTSRILGGGALLHSALGGDGIGGAITGIGPVGRGGGFTGIFKHVVARDNAKALKKANEFFDSFNKVFNVGGNSTSEVIEDMGGYTTKTGKHYTDQELIERFQPKYSYESSTPIQQNTNETGKTLEELTSEVSALKLQLNKISPKEDKRSGGNLKKKYNTRKYAKKKNKPGSKSGGVS